MKNRLQILLAVTSLALAALACQAVTGGPEVPATEPAVPATESDVPIENTQPPADTDVPLPSETEAPEEPPVDSDVLFEDDFTSGGRESWGTGTDADSSVEYVDDGLNMQLFTENYVVWTFPNETDYESIHMEVTVINNGSDSDTAFGFFCYKQYPIDDSRYYFAVTPSGQYAIAKAALAQDDVFLTNNNEWADSEFIAKDAPSYRLGADCGNGTLTLYVDGQQIDSVSDSTYTNGSIALFTWSGDGITTVNVTFDDFLMTQLP